MNRRLSLGLGLAILLASCLSVGKKPRPAVVPPGFSATFLQLWDKHRDWGASRWQELFGYLGKLQVREIFVQWTQHRQRDFHTGRSPVLGRLLRLAEQKGIKIWLGLNHDPSYWSRIQQDPAQLEVYLKRRLLSSVALGNSLAGLVRRHPAVVGWYINDEIDDVNWLAPDRRELLFAHLHELTHRLAALTPGKKIALSGFSNGHADAATLQEFWHDLLARSSVDLVLFQDGVGAGKQDFYSLPDTLKSVAQAAAAQKRTFRVVVELFRQVKNPADSATAFHAVPASLDRLRRQFNEAARFSSLPPVAFSVPEYLTPLGAEPAAERYRQYLDFIAAQNP